MTLAWANRNAKEVVANKWRQVVEHNFSLLGRIIEWNLKNKVWLYRISSDMIPFADHETYGYLWDEWRAALESNKILNPVKLSISRFITLGGRFTIHPGQFVSIGSPNNQVRENSLKNLEYHGQLLDILGLPKNYNCPINIHVSNGSKDCSMIVPNVEESLQNLSDSVRKRLVFENEQSGCWNPENLRKHFPQIPITFDYHHFNINPGTLSLAKALEITSASWPNNDPVQHYSEGRTKPLDTAHSDYVKSLPDQPWDIEVEAKQKDLSIKPFISTRNKLIEGIIY
jgi:UV DNA damage endonuclease